MFALITFLSDFGSTGPYVAACEAVLAKQAPGARVLHVSHNVRLGDVREGALILARVVPLAPSAVHLAVVDPGVGTGRHSLAIQAERGDFLVGPDNGLLIPAVRALGGLREGWALDTARVREQAGLTANGLSRTFHGRDLFAPAAALLARGMPITLLADPLGANLAELAPPRVQKLASGDLLAEVLEIDGFGNVALAVGFSDTHFHPGPVRVRVESEPDAGWQARPVRTYADLQPGELGLLEDSWGQVSLTLNGASASELLGARRGALVRLCEVAAE